MLYQWGHSRRFNDYTNYFRREFGERVQKLSVNAGFTCPNRDGTKGVGGCTYCNNQAFNPSYCHPSKSVQQQIAEGIAFHKKRYRRANKYLAYFQPFSNTHAPVEELKRLYEEALEFPGVVGLVIGTRPDCVDDVKLEYFREISTEYYLIIEYGIESCYDKTLKRINRGHDFEETRQAILKTQSFGIMTGGHLIFGLPGESISEILEEAKIISGLRLDTVKFHQLQIVKNTRMAADYIKDPSAYNLFSLEEYVRFIVRFIERLDPEIVIERFASEVPPRFLAGPGWGKIRYDQIALKIEKELERQDTWQGKFFKGLR